MKRLRQCYLCHRCCELRQYLTSNRSKYACRRLWNAAEYCGWKMVGWSKSTRPRTWVYRRMWLRERTSVKVNWARPCSRALSIGSCLQRYNNNNNDNQSINQSNHKIYIARSKADSVKLNLLCWAGKKHWARRVTVKSAQGWSMIGRLWWKWFVKKVCFEAEVKEMMGDRRWQW